MARSARLACLVALGAVACAAPPTTPVAAVEAAPVRSAMAAGVATITWRLLRDAEHFASDATGDGGHLPDEVIAYRQLLRAPDGAATFRRLLAEARPAGRLYALCGLLELEPANAAEAARATGLLADEELVETLDGCSGRLATLSSVARRLLDPGDAAIAGWRARIRGTGEGWREGGRGDEELATFGALDHLVALDAVIGNGPPPPWSSTAEARADLDAEAQRRRDERELGHIEEHLAEDGVQELRDRLASRLVGLGPAAIPGLVAALRRPEPSVRMTAVIAIERLGAWGEEGLPALAAAVDDPDARVRWLALVALHDRPDRPEVLDGLRRALVRPDEESELLELALVSLDQRELGPELAPALVRLVSHRHPKVREEAMDALSKVGAAGAPALPLLLVEARREEASHLSRLQALGAIAALGSGVAGPALAGLLVELDVERGERQADVARYLTYLEPGERAVATACALERSAPAQARALAAATDGATRIAALEGALDAPLPSARLAALTALGDEPAAAPVLERLAADLTTPGPSDLAAEGLARLGRLGLGPLGRVTPPGPRRSGEHTWSEQRLVGLLRDLLASAEPLDRGAALDWLAAAEHREDAAQTLTDAVGRWLEDWQTEPREPAEWHAALGVLLRWSTTRARHAIERIADDAPPAEVRARAAAALGR